MYYLGKGCFKFFSACTFLSSAVGSYLAYFGKACLRFLNGIAGEAKDES